MRVAVPVRVCLSPSFVAFSDVHLHYVFLVAERLGLALVLQSSLVEDVDVLGNLKHSSHVLFDDEHVSPAILQDLHLLEDIVGEVGVQTPPFGSSNNRISGSGINARPNATIIC